MIHLILRADGVVIAHFLEAADAADFAERSGQLHVPFNLNNRDGSAAPLVGTRYVA